MAPSAHHTTYGDPYCSDCVCPWASDCARAAAVPFCRITSAHHIHTTLPASETCEKTKPPLIKSTYYHNQNPWLSINAQWYRTDPVLVSGVPGAKAPEL